VGFIQVNSCSFVAGLEVFNVVNSGSGKAGCGAEADADWGDN